MKLLKAIEKNKLSITAILEFDSPFTHSDFSFGILSLERKGRSLYLDVRGSSSNEDIILVHFAYDEDVIAPDTSNKADLKVEDLILGLDEAKLYIGDNSHTQPSSIVLYVEGEHQTELKINLTID
jgi:hypothetical protein